MIWMLLALSIYGALKLISKRVGLFSTCQITNFYSLIFHLPTAIFYVGVGRLIAVSLLMEESPGSAGQGAR